ncbi:M23 family metallopeptidase [Sneathiella glossodoripedis]|uniref:M23 family metallopeptidase n=1 Tax=Sneathiella glossodoripedis TaxID=418853 RepID=UPI00047258C9|nr:M23 family metallopeptidase [Sneathiella glossodoripedis]
MNLKGTLGRIFAPRQVIVSKNGQPKYYSFSTRLQVSLVAGGICTAALITGLISQNIAKDVTISKQERQLALLQDRVRDVSSNLLYARSNLTMTKEELDRQYARLEDILSQRENLKSTLQMATATLQKKANDLNSRDEYAKDLENRIKMLSSRLERTNKRSEELSLKITQINKALYQTAEERDMHAEEKLIAQKRLSSLNRELQMFQSSKDEIYKELQQTKKRLSTFEKERSEKEVLVENLQNEVQDLKSRIATISKQNKNLIARVHEQAEQGIDALKQTITLTGLNPDEVLSLDNVEGIGGPFNELSNTRELLEVEQRYYQDALKMEASLAKWTTLNSLMKNIPLARPLDSGYVTSSFGMRRDPISKKKAFHAGIDMSGPRNSPILATAPGKVVFAGHSGAYGKMVEIDHGQGFKTKFGHLKKIHVKRGDQVDFRTKIGTMGSTGRSTGRHVHYEIIYNGKNQNPAKFFKAGNYAFKTSSVLEEAKD